MIAKGNVHVGLSDLRDFLGLPEEVEILSAEFNCGTGLLLQVASAEVVPMITVESNSWKNLRMNSYVSVREARERFESSKLINVSPWINSQEHFDKVFLTKEKVK